MTSGNKKNGEKKRKTEKADYKPTEQERAALSRYFERRKKKSPARLKVTRVNGVPKVGPDHPETTVGYALLMEAIGTADNDFLHGIIGQLINAGSLGQDADEAGANFMLSVIKDIAPKDQVETMLAAQMAAVHLLAMTFARRLAHVDNIQQQDSAEKGFNKLTRTFATQMEALKRYRTGGEQKVTVQHVSVSEGGQAIVGNVTQTPQDNAPAKAPAAPLAITHSKTDPMPIFGESKQAAPIPARRRRDK